jgi:hypothetical protein
MALLQIRVKQRRLEQYQLMAEAEEISLPDWIRDQLDRAVYNGESGSPMPRLKQAPPVAPQNPADLLRDIPGLQRGSEIEVLDRPRWVEENEPTQVKVARGRLFGSNPLRKLSQLEVEFNKLATFPFQKFNDQGRPLLDQHEMPILYE